MSSLVILISSTRPRSVSRTSSSLKFSDSSLNTLAPVAIAMSLSVAFRLSPKPGALTAQTLMLALSLEYRKIRLKF